MIENYTNQTYASTRFINVIKSGKLGKWKRETRFQGENTRSVLTNFDIFCARLRLQLSSFYYYRQLDDSFFAVAIEYPVGKTTINFFIDPKAFLEFPVILDFSVIHSILYSFWISLIFDIIFLTF